MTDSFYERRRKELGIGSTTTNHKKEPSAGLSFYEQRRMNLGLIPDTRPSSGPLQPTVSRTDYAALGKSLQPGNTANMDTRMRSVAPSPLDASAGIAAFQQSHPQPVDTSTPYERWYNEHITNSQLGKLMGLAQSADRAISNAKAGIMDTATIGASRGLGRLAIATMPQGQQNLTPLLNDRTDSTAYKIGEYAGYIPPGVAIERGLARIGGKALSKIGSKTAQRAISGLASGALQGAAQEAGNVAFRGGKFDPINVAESGIAGGAIEASLPFIGKAAKAVADRTGLTDKLVSFISRNRAVNPELETATKDLIQPPRQIGIATGPLRNATNEQYINKVMSDIRPIVTERMTPPLENPNELAKWLQPHLDTSLNQIRRLDYNDMVELANEVQSHMSTYDVAKQVAKERGYNLDQILNNQTPSIKNTADRLRMGRVAGAVEPPNTNVRLAISPEYKPSAPPTNVLAEPPAQQDWFTRLFGSRGVGISAFGQQGKAGTAQQIVTNATKRDVKGLAGGVKALAQSAYQAQVDALSPIKRNFSNAYDIAMDSNRSNNIAEQIIRDKFVTPEGVAVGDSLTDVMKDVPRGTDSQFIDYIVLRDAKDRVARGERVYEERLGMNDPQKIKDRISMYDQRHPQFAEAAKKWDAFTKNLRTVYGLDSGLLNQAQISAMEAARPNYAPMRRQFSLSESVKRGFGANTNGFSGQRAPIKEVSPTGSVRKIVDPRKTLIEATQQWVRASMNNRVMQSIISEIKQNPEAFKDIAEIVQPKKGQPNLAQILATEGEEGMLESINQDFSRLFQKTNLNHDNIVRGMVKGEPVYVKVKDPELVAALTSLGPERADVLAKIFGTFSKMTKRSATGLLAPLFAVKGLTADTVQALIQSPNKIAHIGDFTHALVSSIAEAIPGLRNTPLANMANDYRRSGGMYSSILRTERGLNKQLGGLKRNGLLEAGTIARGAWKGIKTLSGYTPLEKIGDIGENVNRMAAFRGELRRRGFERTPENVRAAANAAREITTNFSRKGTWSKSLESVIPYNNAAIQGARRMLVAFKDHPLATTASVTALVIVPKIIEYNMFANDPDYQKLPARERYRNLIVKKNSDGTFVKVPMPPEYGAIGAFTEDLMRKYIGNDKAAMKGVSDALVNAWAPPFAYGLAQGLTQGGGVEKSVWGAINSTSPGSLIGAAANQSFTGSPIVPMSMQDRSQKYQYDERTSSVAKRIGSILNWSPKKVDYLLRAYGGDPARVLLPLTSQSAQGQTKRTLLRNFIADPVYTNVLADDFYSAKDLIQRAYADNKDVGAPLPSWYSDEVHRIVTSTATGSYMRQLKGLSDQKKTIEADKMMKSSVRADKLRDLQAQINNLYTEINSKLMDAGVPFKGR